MKVLKLFGKAILCGILPMCLLGGSLSVSAYTGSAPQAKTNGANLRVMSYNVLVDNDESLGGWNWGQALGSRGDKASACIAYYQPDVIGFQECNYKWHVSLKDNLKDYAFVNADVPEVQPLEKAESLGKKDWMCTTMMYNTKTLKLVHNELVGYSCNYWGCIQRMRYASIAVFEIKASGERFTFISTHLDAEQSEKGQEMRMTQSNELADCIKRYKSTYGYPVISTGDYNSGYNDPPIQNVVSKAGMTASSGNRGGIDYILYSAGIQSKYFTVVSDADVLPASDHKPVFADFKLEKYTFPTTKATKATTTTTTTTEAPTQGSAVVITKPTQNTGSATTTTGKTATTGTKNEAPTSSVTSGTEQDATTSATGEDTTTEMGDTTQTEGMVETVGTVTTQAQNVSPSDQAEEGLSGPLLALIAGGSVLALMGVGIGIYLLVAKKKQVK